jgi:hypothetical protein
MSSLDFTPPPPDEPFPGLPLLPPDEYYRRPLRGCLLADRMLSVQRPAARDEKHYVIVDDSAAGSLAALPADQFTATMFQQYVKDRLADGKLQDEEEQMNTIPCKMIIADVLATAVSAHGEISLAAFAVAMRFLARHCSQETIDGRWVLGLRIEALATQLAQRVSVSGAERLHAEGQCKAGDAVHLPLPPPVAKRTAAEWALLLSEAHYLHQARYRDAANAFINELLQQDSVFFVNCSVGSMRQVLSGLLITVNLLLGQEKYSNAQHVWKQYTSVMTRVLDIQRRAVAF